MTVLDSPPAVAGEPTGTGDRPPAPAPGRPGGDRVFRAAVVTISLLVVLLIIASVAELVSDSWAKYGTGIPRYYWVEVFGNAAMRQMLLNTVIVVLLSCLLATLAAAVLAWFNERTEASMGALGRLLPLIPFLMPAVAFPLGWVVLAAPQAGALNVAIREFLGVFGIGMDTGPLNIFSWPGLVFLYAVHLVGFAYLALVGPMRSLDSGLEEAAQISGASVWRVLFRIVLPAIRPSLAAAFMLCVIPGVAMVSVPIVIGPGAGIDVLPVHVVRLVTTRQPALFEEAFLQGLLLLLPILGLWWVQRQSAGAGRSALVGGRAAASIQVRLGRGRTAVARTVLLGYVFLAVVLPVLGLLYVSGLGFWSSSWPSRWNPLPNLERVLNDSTASSAVTWSIVLGLSAGLVLVLVAHVITYGRRLLPRFGTVIDGFVKSPAAVPNILQALGVLVVLGSAACLLAGTPWILFVGYLVGFIAYASVLAGGTQQQIGRDMIDAARVSGASEFRVLRSVVTPLSRDGLLAALVLMFILVSGELNISLILSTSNVPVVGRIMLDMYEFGSLPRVTTFAMVMVVVNLVCIGLLLRLLSGHTRRQR